MADVLVTARIAAQMLGCTTQSVAYLRQHGMLVPAKSAPFRYRIQDVEAHRARREGAKVNGPRYGVEIL
jgi:hypothetical protein